MEKYVYGERNSFWYEPNGEYCILFQELRLFGIPMLPMKKGRYFFVSPFDWERNYLIMLFSLAGNGCSDNACK